MLNKEKLNANAVGVVAHSDPKLNAIVNVVGTNCVRPLFVLIFSRENAVLPYDWVCGHRNPLVPTGRVVYGGSVALRRSVC